MVIDREGSDSRRVSNSRTGRVVQGIEATRQGSEGTTKGSLSQQAVFILGGPSPYREAMRSRFLDSGVRVLSGCPVTHHDVTDLACSIAIVYCSEKSDWAYLHKLADANLDGRLAVLEHDQCELFRQALLCGASAVHADTSTDVIASAALLAGKGEVSLPSSVALRLVGDAKVETQRPVLDHLEMDLLRSVAHGETIVSIAKRYFFSERTMRRRLRSAYLKLGAKNRVEAMRAADRLGILDC